MHHFFVQPQNVKEEYISIVGGDVNHIKNVLRMKEKEDILISDGNGCDYTCVIYKIQEDEIIAKICDVSHDATELPGKLYLFQGLPKNDKMELIIQKAVELGAAGIIPVSTSRCVVKLDEKKEATKLKRWQKIAESAAKQSKRGVIPQVHNVLSFKEAVKMAGDLQVGMIPYENFKDMSSTKSVIDKIRSNMSVGIFIGPEGGFCESEVEYAKENGIEPISLGNRILRTETAGLAILSILMFKMETED
ncbi:MAG: 16S rRNA (uracil(1498)-N(3))-methyltransferase [Clostridiales bacterium]|nr:16S rRNA (uracil(1498)-N(3))-methyltransferase [Clostridiales bacterium]